MWSHAELDELSFEDASRATRVDRARQRMELEGAPRQWRRHHAGRCLESLGCKVQREPVGEVRNRNDTGHKHEGSLDASEIDHALQRMQDRTANGGTEAQRQLVQLLRAIGYVDLDSNATDQRAAVNDIHGFETVLLLLCGSCLRVGRTRKIEPHASRRHGQDASPGGRGGGGSGSARHWHGRGTTCRSVIGRRGNGLRRLLNRGLQADVDRGRAVWEELDALGERRECRIGEHEHLLGEVGLECERERVVPLALNLECVHLGVLLVGRQVAETERHLVLVHGLGAELREANVVRRLRVE